MDKDKPSCFNKKEFTDVEFPEKFHSDFNGWNGKSAQTIIDDVVIQGEVEDILWSYEPIKDSKHGEGYVLLAEIVLLIDRREIRSYRKKCFYPHNSAVLPAPHEMGCFISLVE